MSPDEVVGSRDSCCHSIGSTPNNVTVYLLFQIQLYTPNVTVTGGFEGAKGVMKIFITPQHVHVSTLRPHSENFGETVYSSLT